MTHPDKTKPDFLPDGSYTYCGQRLKPVGVGKQPYECAAKDEHPDAMIYMSDGGGWDYQAEWPGKGEQIKQP